MTKKTTLRKMGGSLGVTLPKEVIDRLQMREGDSLSIVDTDDGVKLSPYDPEFDRAMEIYERGARKYRNALRELAS
jgi:putative addiction module antidote